jgi:EAL and modified HD-GYP domain-containing signal transduction protein
MERLISQDAVLNVQLLRYINSAALGLRRKVESLRHAVFLLDHAEIRKWSALVAVFSVDNKPYELIRTALWRASMCELLCEDSGQGRSGKAVIVGLFSLLEALYDRPLAELLELLPLDVDIRVALQGGQNVYATILACVFAYERGDWPAVHCFHLQPAQINAIYLRAVRRADQVMNCLFESEYETASMAGH